VLRNSPVGYFSEGARSRVVYKYFIIKFHLCALSVLISVPFFAMELCVLCG
jgi:hypothetical protein